MYRCEFVEKDLGKICNRKVMLSISKCKYCSKNYCSIHYLIEKHKCSGIDEMKKIKRKQLSDQLMTEKVVSTKVARI